MGGPNLRRVAAILTLAFLAMVGTPGVGVAGSTLDGEKFEWRGVGFNGNFTCDFIAGTGNVIEYQIFGGIADGPFTGDFREDGFISISTAGTWRGHFTVTDPATGAIVVEGSTSGSSTATCNSVNFGQSVSGAASATLTYTATIHAIGGEVPAIASGIAAARLTFNRGGDRVTGSSFEENLGGVDGFTLSGQVFDTSVAGPLVPGALVQVCQLPAGPCSTQTADGNGAFSFTGLAGFTSYEVRADPPAGFTLLPRIRVVKLNGSTVKDLFLHAPVAPPAGTTITNRGTNPDGLPIVYWRDPLILTTTGCPGATTATYSIDVPPTDGVAGFMTEGPAGTYTASIPPLDPRKGYGSVDISLPCPGDPFPTDVLFDIYVDPSGAVRTTTGEPVLGATVTLLRSDIAGGPFVPVPDGSATMSLENRNNPDATDGRGLFGWDVIAGTYQVRAEKRGCVSPTEPTQTFVLSPVLIVPPAIVDLDLRVSCASRDTTPPTTIATRMPVPNESGWNNGDVTVTLAASDEAGGSGVKEIHFSLAGSQGDRGVVTGSMASVRLSSEGSSTLTYFATDNAGNTEAAKTLMVRLDKTAPTMTFGSPTPPANAAGWHNGGVSIAFAAADSLSGVGVTTPSSPLVLTTEGRGVTQTVTVADLAGNSATFTSPAVNIDKTPPAVTCSVSPNVLWPPNHKMVTVKAAVDVSDSLSGPGGFTLIAVTSNEPIEAGDIEAFALGTPAATGQLRADRFGGGSGRVYTLTYQGVDIAGNSALCSTTVTVPHDQR